MYSFKGYKFYNHLQEIREINVIKDAVTHEILAEYILDDDIAENDEVTIKKIDDLFTICKNIDVQIMEEDEQIWLLINTEKEKEKEEEDTTVSEDVDDINDNKSSLLWESIQTHNHFNLINNRIDNIFRLEEKKNVLLSRL